MPLYKYVGNRILTRVQNVLLRHAPDRVPQRLPRLLGGGAAADPLPAELERLPLRHRDHHPAAQRRAAHRGAADPDLLRRRDLPGERDEVRERRRCSRRCATSPTAPACSTSGASTRQRRGQRALRSEARLREQPPVRPRRGARRARRCSTSARARAAWPASCVKKGCRVAVVDQFAPDEVLDPTSSCSRQDLDERADASTSASYDYLLLLDVIEHLKDPERFLERLRAQFDYSPRTLILTTPNVAFVVQRADAAVRTVQLRQGRHPRPHAHPAVHLPDRCASCSSTPASGSRTIRGVPAPFPKVLGNGRARQSRRSRSTSCSSASAGRCSRIRSSSSRRRTPDVDFILQDSKRRSALHDLIETTSGDTTWPRPVKRALRSVFLNRGPFDTWTVTTSLVVSDDWPHSANRRGAFRSTSAQRSTISIAPEDGSSDTYRTSRVRCGRSARRPALS